MILLDEFDSGFEDDPDSYLASLRHVIRTSKAPVIMTCDYLLPKQISFDGLSLSDGMLPAEVIRLSTPDLIEISRKLLSIMEREGNLFLDEKGAIRLARHFHCDLRAILHHVHFWGDRSLSQLSPESSLLNMPGSSKPFSSTLKDDGFENLIDGYQPVIERVRPIPMSSLMDKLIIEGDNFGEDVGSLVVRVGVQECPQVTLDSSKGLLSAFVKVPNKKTGSSQSPEPQEEDELEDELEDDDFEPVTKKSRTNAKSGKRFQIWPDLVVQKSIQMILEAENGTQIARQVTLISNDELSRRHNSWIVCPEYYEQSPGEGQSVSMVRPLQLTRQVRLDEARRCLQALQNFERCIEINAFVDCLIKVRRGKDCYEDEVPLHYSTFDELGSTIGKHGLHYDAYMDWLSQSLDEKKDNIVRQMKSAQIRIDHDQPKSAYYLDIPMYIRMSRLDELCRETHSGRRRRLASHFSRNDMNWLVPARVAKLGLKDLDLGWSPPDEDDEQLRDDDEDFMSGLPTTTNKKSHI